ncbi:MAG: Alpha-glucosidase [Alphaproteobacteria bacterium MarineAlpha5_Bin5]|nr:MAG: Alpha-glucosidase [Alphaproteobacteria bacterium MarineAlpha5_Bin4]PPR50417.1 MAG: Alpha-glucosidase [Alphaproteobacteria bacterium MarineAlpha5_Bin5]|tara:strand:- start:1439 stop:2746 length:1308 start_codon:yes stop_codon:yes gene_type:complete
MNKIVLIGAGSANFGLGTIGDIFKSKVLEGSTIILHDINAKALEKTKNIANKFKDKLKVSYNIEATTDRKQALKGAAYCIISIEIGNRFDLWDQDWKIPLQYGFKQIYGENGGPGGLFHSLRIAPVILSICEDIIKICPNAFVFNYSNPMQRICHAVTTKYPELKFVGLCHEIASMERQLPYIMETNFSNIEIKAGGLNHLSILLEAKYKDSQKDGYPKIKKKFKSYYSKLTSEYYPSKPGGERGVFFELYKLFGYLPITTDSHLGEYIQWAYSVADHEAIMKFYENYKKRCLTFYDDESHYSEFFQLHNKINERIIPIIEAIIQDANIEESAVNIPNKNFINCLPDNIVVEVPGLISKSGVAGVKLNNYPANFGNLLNTQVSTIQLTTEAVINQSKDSAYLALLSDPIVDNVENASKLLETMLVFQKEYLGYLK